jgi:hypothetical protein
MPGQGINYDLATLRGYDALQRRFHAIGTLDATFMRDLGGQAIREQKKLLYTEAVTRRTGHSGQLITLENVTETSASTVARGTAVFADTGTRPHEIRPNAKKALRWAVSSSKGFRLTGVPKAGSVVQWAFAKVVHHPGTKPHPYMVRGAKMAIAGAGLTDRIIAKWNGAA